MPRSGKRHSATICYHVRDVKFASMKRNFVDQFRLSAIPDDRYSLCRPIAEPQPSLPSISADRYPESFHSPFCRHELLRPLEFKPFNRIVFRRSFLRLSFLSSFRILLRFEREKGLRDKRHLYENMVRRKVEKFFLHFYS